MAVYLDATIRVRKEYSDRVEDAIFDVINSEVIMTYDGDYYIYDVSHGEFRVPKDDKDYALIAVGHILRNCVDCDWGRIFIDGYEIDININRPNTISIIHDDIVIEYPMNYAYGIFVNIYKANKSIVYIVNEDSINACENNLFTRDELKIIVDDVVSIFAKEYMNAHKTIYALKVDKDRKD